MAKRDPEKTARNKRIAEMKKELRAMLPQVLAETGVDSEASLNAKIGSKIDEFIDLKEAVILSPDDYVNQWFEGLEGHLSTSEFETQYDKLYDLFANSRVAQNYLNIFLQRSYLNHFEELSKKRPKTKEAELWIGENNYHYGLLVAPRFRNGEWENDKSEIRRFSDAYWSIGHVLTTGLVIPGKEKKVTFKSLEDYLSFFEDGVVRGTGSKYQRDLASRYCEYVRKAAEPRAVPLLIPELRYWGTASKHRYRLDFCIIDNDMNKVGFELSPWSTHGLLEKIKGKTQKEVNKEAAANFERETRKCREYFHKFGITVLIYTDESLADMDSIFEEMKTYLKAKTTPVQLGFHLRSRFFAKKKASKTVGAAVRPFRAF